MRSPIVIVNTLVSIQVLGCFGGTPNSRLNFFDIDVLRSTVEDKAGNVVISPASVKSTLAMLLEGAEGLTASEIRNALRVSPAKAEFRKELNTFLTALEVNTTNVLLHNANALFVSKKLRLKKDYEDVVQGIYFSEVAKLDFDNPPSSVDTINRWVSNKTQGLIPSIVDEALITPLTELLVANALYFKASWKYGFDVKSTYSDCFYNNGVCRNVAMMDLQAELKYAFVKELRAHALELPYQNDRYCMFVLVPQQRDAVGALVRDLPYIGLPQITDMLEPIDVVLTMPKFTIEYSTNLIEALKKMRINSLFSSLSNLSGIFESEAAYVNSIYQSVYMKVDEVGTEAAASTVGLVVPLINDQVQLRVDRPFLFFIRDKKLGLNLFEGKIEEPTEFPKPDNKKEETVQIQPSPKETDRSKHDLLPSRRANADLAGSGYSNFNQGYQPSVQSNQDPYHSTYIQSSQNQAPIIKSSEIIRSSESGTQKSSSGISGWFQTIKQVFLRGNR